MNSGTTVQRTFVGKDFVRLLYFKVYKFFSNKKARLEESSLEGFFFLKAGSFFVCFGRLCFYKVTLQKESHYFSTIEIAVMRAFDVPVLEMV